MKITLPAPGGTLQPYRLAPPRAWPVSAAPIRGRIAYAAAHVVADPAGDPADPVPSLDWTVTSTLIRRTAEAAKDYADPAELVAGGAGTDHARDAGTLDAIVAAYLEQAETVRAAGASVVLMASRELARVARGPDDYLRVYTRVLEQADRPVIVHWLGEMFDPLLAGYWGSRDLGVAARTVLDLVTANAARVDGIKVSLLDADREIALRAALPPSVRLYTGDDFSYPALIASGSDALLGIFDAIAPAAAAALRRLDDGDAAGYEEILAPTVPLARTVFEAPTCNYKTGLVFLAWLAGHQDAFVMVRGAQSARSLPHLAAVFRLADRAGLLPDSELAARRMATLLAQYGITR